MKTTIILGIGLCLAAVTVRADLANYQTTLTGQSPNNYFSFDNSSLSPAAGSATLASSGGAGFGNDYWNNANDAALFPNLTDYLTGSGSMISGANTATAVGSMSMLFYLPSTVPNTAYLFSDGDATSGSYFAFDLSGGSSFQLKIGNTTKTLTGTPAIAANTWYYFGVTYNRNGTVAGVNGVNWYLGTVGGSLDTGFIQNGGTGNISATSTLGDGGTFVLGNRRAENNSMGLGSEIDEFAAWNTQLTGLQMTSQFDALTVTATPEPSSLALLGAGGLLLARRRKSSARFHE